MPDDDKRIDAFDVAALEKSLNDSATRVSTIWVSFLIFSLYLLTAATTVTHRQLLLAEPVKLPVLNIDLPLWGFFFLAPILFVILHAYVLIQVILLARTAAAYSAAVDRVAKRDNLTPEENASLRQRLANTLFAQIFAGSPREREGAFGGLLRAMAWITLAISPILILLTFQFTFLPYHSHGVTWTHRLLILLEIVVAFQLWPLVLSPRRNFQWPNWRAGLREVDVHLRWLFLADGRAKLRQGLRQQAIPIGAALMFALLSLSFASFPGEPHVNMLTGQPFDAVQCERWLHQDFRHLDLRVDRLRLRGVDIVDDEQLEKIEKAAEKIGEQPYEGQRTRDLRRRDLNCGDFSHYADLRRVGLDGAQLKRANLFSAKLQGSSLEGAQLQGAFLINARLQGASLFRAKLQGAELNEAQLQFAYLDHVELQGAFLRSAQLQGAYLQNAQLDGAHLEGAQLQGAILNGAELRGASVDRAQLHGAWLNDAILEGATFSGVWLGQARGADCTKARVINPNLDAVFLETPSIFATPDNIDKQIAKWLSGVPGGESRNTLIQGMRERLTIDTTDDAAALADAWAQCAEASSKLPQNKFEKERLELLRSLVCDDRDNGAVIGAAMAATLNERFLLPEFRTALARALRGEDGRKCAAAAWFDEPTRRVFRDSAGPPPEIAPIPLPPLPR